MYVLVSKDFMIIMRKYIFRMQVWRILVFSTKLLERNWFILCAKVNNYYCSTWKLFSRTITFVGQKYISLEFFFTTHLFRNYISFLRQWSRLLVNWEIISHDWVRNVLRVKFILCCEVFRIIFVTSHFRLVFYYFKRISIKKGGKWHAK